MPLGRVSFFLVHCLLHLFGYVIPRALRFIGSLFFCRPCLEQQRKLNGYIYHPEREVRLVYHPDVTECVTDVFGLMDVKASQREDRQYVVDTDIFATKEAVKEESARLAAEAEACLLFYDRPLYSGHMNTILGSLRPERHVPYVRERATAWDGCPLFLDWLYVDGFGPQTSYVHDSSPSAGLAHRQDAGPYTCSSSQPNKAHRMPPPPSFTPVTDSKSFESLNGPLYFGSTTENETTGSGSERQDSVPAAPHPLNPHRKPHPAAPPAATSREPFQDLHSRPEAVKGVCVVMPGLSSHSQSNYVQSFVLCMHAHGYHCCVLNTRGMAPNTPLTTNFLFNGAYTRDCRDCLRSYLTKAALVERFGYPLPVIGCGLSNGGATLSKYLGEQGRAGRDPVLDAGITVCAPNDIVRMVEHMNRGTYQKGLYQQNMCDDVRNYILCHPELQRMPNVDNDWVMRQGNIHRFTRVIHFDEHVIAKSAGYRSIHHYHTDASAIVWLPYTPIPLCVMSSFDDPVIGRTVMPHRWKEIALNNPRIVYVESRPGGHLAYLGSPWAEARRKPNWMECFVLQRMNSVSACWHRKQQQWQQDPRVSMRWFRPNDLLLAAPPKEAAPLAMVPATSPPPAGSCVPAASLSTSLPSCAPKLPDCARRDPADAAHVPEDPLTLSSRTVAHSPQPLTTFIPLPHPLNTADLSATIGKCLFPATPVSWELNHGDDIYFARNQPPPHDRLSNKCYFSGISLSAVSVEDILDVSKLSTARSAAMLSSSSMPGSGEYRYNPVAINCDYSVDTRALMRHDL